MAEKMELVLNIGGMSCTACASAIDKGLNNKEGVLKAVVNFSTEKAYITYDRENISPNRLIKLIEGLGYTARLDMANLTKKTMNIGGMSCISCAKGLEKTLHQVDGVSEASINFSTEKMNLIYDQESISIQEILKIIEKAGYSANVLEDSALAIDESLVSDDSHHQKENVVLMRNKMITAAILSGAIMLLMILNMVGLQIPSTLYHSVTVLLAFPVVFILGHRVHKSSWNSIKHKSANMDVLVSLGSLPPYLIGLLGFFMEMQTFVEMAAAIMTFHLIGKYLETKAKGRASDAIKKLIKLGAKTARIEVNGDVKEIPVRNLNINDVMHIKAGEKIPTDGIILEGNTSIDESMVSGESMPVTKKKGDEIIGATINQLGFIKAQVTKIGKDTFLSQIIKLVEECQGSKVPIQEFADKVTGYFVPAILIITATTFTSYLLFTEFHRSILLWGANFLPWVNPGLPPLSLAFITATAVLVISCPCALGLGTPTALMVGSGIGAERGILIRNGEAVQTLKDVNVIAFDKTGTITKGKPEVTNIITSDNLNESELLFYAASLESVSEHPLAQAVMESAKEKNIVTSSPVNIETIPGKGIKGIVSGKQVTIGNSSLLEQEQIKITDLARAMEELESEAKTVILVALDNKLKGLIAIADQIKDDSAQAISFLNRLGIATVMITGDNEKTALAIANKVGIERVVSRVLPDGKVDVVKKLQQEYSIVAMVGDGINDAPSLKQANVGIALGSGTDIAIEAADITLVNNNLMSVVTAIKLSKATFRKIKENFFWAWFYNAVAIPVAVMGLLHPMIGAAAMSMSSLNVVYNSLRLRRVKL